MVKALVAWVLWLGSVWIFALVSIIAPQQSLVYAFGTTQYSRVVREAEKIANLAFNKPFIVNEVAKQVVKPSLTSIGIRMVTGPIGWGLLGISSGLALYQIYYDAQKLQQIKDNSEIPGTWTVPTIPTLCPAPNYCTQQTFTSGPNTFDYFFDLPAGQNCPGSTGWFQMPGPNNTVRCAHKVGQPNQPSQGDSQPPTIQTVTDFLDDLPPTSPLAPEANTQTGGTTGQPTTAAETVTKTVNNTEVTTEVVNKSTITTGDVVVKENESPPAGTETTTTKEQGATTTTTTTTNPDGSKTEETSENVSTSCSVLNHDPRTLQSIWETHKATWANTTILSYLTLLQNLTWPSMLPVIPLSSANFGTLNVDFNEWAWFFTALRTLVIFGATLVSYRIVFAGRS